MSNTLGTVKAFVKQDRVRVSEHGDDELLEDMMDLEILLSGIETAIIVEDYPNAFKGPSVLVLQDHAGQPVHVIWGLAKQKPDAATLITAYSPSPEKMV